MNRICTFKEFEIYQLTKEIAEKYVVDIIAALNLIPMVEKHSKEEVLAEIKGDRVLHAKWSHSLVALTNTGEFVGVIVGYERDKENNEQYPLNCIYLSDLAVSDRFQKQGVGAFLTKQWLEWNMTQGFIELAGDLRFSVQTNKAEWNSHVQRLYESLGFTKIAEKNYENRTDIVYALSLLT